MLLPMHSNRIGTVCACTYMPGTMLTMISNAQTTDIEYFFMIVTSLSIYKFRDAYFKSTSLRVSTNVPACSL
jgi:hypothetical protein